MARRNSIHSLKFTLICMLLPTNLRLINVFTTPLQYPLPHSHTPEQQRGWQVLEKQQPLDCPQAEQVCIKSSRELRRKSNSSIKLSSHGKDLILSLLHHNFVFATSQETQLTHIADMTLWKYFGERKWVLGYSETWDCLPLLFVIKWTVLNQS